MIALPVEREQDMQVRWIAVVVALLAFAAGTPAHAGEKVSQQSRMDAEVNALLGEMRASGCRFNRNGSWYGSTEASEHLNKKYDYLRSRLASTEQFIEKGGSTSSMSGKAYLVQCGDAKAVTSGAWLTAKLGELRKSGKLEQERREAEEEHEREKREAREKR